MCRNRAVFQGQGRQNYDSPTGCKMWRFGHASALRWFGGSLELPNVGAGAAWRGNEPVGANGSGRKTSAMATAARHDERQRSPVEAPTSLRDLSQGPAPHKSQNPRLSPRALLWRRRELKTAQPSGQRPSFIEFYG